MLADFPPLARSLQGQESWNVDPVTLRSALAMLKKLGLEQLNEDMTACSTKIHVLTHKLEWEQARLSPGMQGMSVSMLQGEWVVRNGLVDVNYVGLRAKRLLRHSCFSGDLQHS